MKYSIEQENALKALRSSLGEDTFWQAVIAFQKYPFHTASGLAFSYSVKLGRQGQLTKELVIDRRENSKTLTWGSIRLAFSHALELRGTVVERPKALGDIRGVSYIYPLLWHFGLIEVSEKCAQKMAGD